jgi:hypothetical protein
MIPMDLTDKQWALLEAFLSGPKKWEPDERGRAGKTTKVMAIAEGTDAFRSISIADGSRHDASLVDQTLEDSFTKDVAPFLIGDKAFDSKPLAKSRNNERNVEFVAPLRGGPRPSTRKQDGRKLRRY